MNRIFTLVFCALFSLLGLLSLQAQVKVVSLSPIASKALVLLQAQGQVVGCTAWCPFADDKLVVANAIDVNVEQVLRAKPDIIFASTLTSKESIATLNKLGLDVILLPRTSNFEVMCDELLLIGDKVGKSDLAKAEVAKARARLAEVKKRIPEGAKPKVMFQVGAKPIFVGIPNTFIADYMTQAGAENIYNDLTHGTVTRESVILRNPEAIFISTLPASAGNAKDAWDEYGDLKAAQNDNVVLIDQELASSPTIHTFVDVVEIMIDVLYTK